MSYPFDHANDNLRELRSDAVCRVLALSHPSPRPAIIAATVGLAAVALFCFRRHQRSEQVFIKGKNNDEALRTLKSGDAFGELALMYNSPRTATVKVDTWATVSSDRTSSVRGDESGVLPLV